MKFKAVLKGPTPWIIISFLFITGASYASWRGHRDKEMELMLWGILAYLFYIDKKMDRE